eukprot:PITA_04899
MSNYEREASIRPSIFEGTNFVYWKVRVTAYLQSLGTEVWDIIETGYTFPSATPTDPTEKKKYETNAKAVNTLLGCLSQPEFVKVMQYKSAKEIWDKTVLSYEGDGQVKRAILQTLRIQYENLKMYNDESVANYFFRVDEIVNCTRPDIMHAVGIVGRFQANPKETNLQAVKKILKYLQGTQNYGLWYPRDTDLTLHAYTDADWARSVDVKGSTSSGAFFMGSRLVSWFSKKQSSIALSTAEAKYVVVASCCTQLLWMMQTLQDFQITCTPPISILCDNTSAINISNNPVMHSITKHIPIKYHFLREQVFEQKVKLLYVPSKEQVADILTKPLPRETFEYLRKKLGVADASSYC